MTVTLNMFCSKSFAISLVCFLRMIFLKELIKLVNTEGNWLFKACLPRAEATNLELICFFAENIIFENVELRLLLDKFDGAFEAKFRCFSGLSMVDMVVVDLMMLSGFASSLLTF